MPIPYLILNVCNLPRTLPAWLILKTLPKNTRGLIVREQRYWGKLHKLGSRDFWIFSRLVVEARHYRNLLHHRIRIDGKAPVRYLLVRFLFPPMESLHLRCRNIGECLFIQHGFATTVTASAIGDYCWINQQVTVGFDVDKPGAPRLGNGVRICAGAKIIGDISMGDNSIAGANAVVVKDVAANAVVGGIPAKPISTNESHILYPPEN